MSRVPPAAVALLLSVALFFLAGLVQPNFVNAAQAINIVRLAAFLGIIAAGQTLVIISGGEGIDLSVGAVVTLGAILTFMISGGSSERLWLALLVVLAVGAAIGLVNGLGIVFVRIPPLVMTLGMAGVVQGTILAVTRGNIPGGVPRALANLVTGRFLGVPGAIYLWALLGLLMWFVLQRTRYGRELFAVGVNRRTAALSGVNVSGVVVLTYTLSGLLAALGGLLLLGFTQRVFLTLGETYLFPSIAAVVVGGTVLAGGRGSYFGTMAGALVLTMTESLLRSMRIGEAYQMIVFGAILVVLLSVYGRQRERE
ncbi:MAG: ABC transporter permease [Deinococcales bacterium]|nr:ABC transporter permease [Deinococcales bacterium]